MTRRLMARASALLYIVLGLSPLSTCTKHFANGIYILLARPLVLDLMYRVKYQA